MNVMIRWIERLRINQNTDGLEGVTYGALRIILRRRVSKLVSYEYHDKMNKKKRRNL